jgi:predicted alpha/beta hydrolase family esterase
MPWSSFTTFRRTPCYLYPPNNIMNQYLPVVAACAALAVNVVAVAAASPAPTVKNIVLVHGAFADGSGWMTVANILRGDGFSVSVAQPPETSLDDDVAATNRTIDAMGGPVVLVGHSYGGVIITAAGNNEHVKSLVYVAAFQPDTGESLGSLAASGLSVKAAGAPGGVPAWKSKPSFAIVATNDRAINPDLERSMYKRSGSTVTELASSHVAYISHPAEVAAVIERAAR